MLSMEALLRTFLIFASSSSFLLFSLVGYVIFVVGDVGLFFVMLGDILDMEDLSVVITTIGNVDEARLSGRCYFCSRESLSRLIR